MMTRRWLGFLVAASAVIALACAAPAAEPPAATPTAIEESPQIQFLLATSDLAAEDSRFAFALVGLDGKLLEGGTVSTTFYRLQGDTATAAQAGPAVYRAIELEEPHVHTSGETHVHREVLGVYVVDRVRFETPGTWGVRVKIEGVPGGPYEAGYSFRVKERSLTPAIGSPAPATVQKTARDVADLKEISSREPPEPELYQKTIAEAVSSGRPSVIVFSTPAYCQSRVCGPVLEAVLQVMPAYRDRVDFIHVEPYDLAKIRIGGAFELAPAAQEWGLPSEPWTFLVDSQGKIAAKFDGIIVPEELEAALNRLP